MDENAALQAKIAALSGQIKQRKEAPSSYASPSYYQSPYYNSSHPRASPRWAPYNRGGRASYPATHRNRTLVVGGPQSDGSPASTGSVGAKSPDKPSQSQFVSTRGAGKNQLMTKETFDRERAQKMEYTPSHEPPQRTKRPQSSGNGARLDANAQHIKREIIVDGIRFRMADDGSKLFRVSCERLALTAARNQLNPTAPDDSSTPTPRTFKIADVTFIRTKHGNLVRAKSAIGNKSNPATTRKPQCEHFTKYGNCPFGPSCRFTHDPRKVAICKDFLRNGSCPAGKHCDLSHEPTYHRVPACTHFLRGNCTNSACRYPHVHVSPAAPVCRPFATLGYCAKGDSCPRRHVIECPDYSNHGQCANREKGSCPLPHVDRAHALRKAAKREGGAGSEDESDLSSGEDEAPSDNDVVDEDSDGPEDFDMNVDVNGHELTQQQDFVPFG